MPWFSSTTLVLLSLLRSAARASLTFLGPPWDGQGGRYHPEQHYMRGPGPKWREKHFFDSASSAGGR